MKFPFHNSHTFSQIEWSPQREKFMWNRKRRNETWWEHAQNISNSRECTSCSADSHIWIKRSVNHVSRPKNISQIVKRQERSSSFSILKLIALVYLHNIRRLNKGSFTCISQLLYFFNIMYFYFIFSWNASLAVTMIYAAFLLAAIVLGLE